MTQWCTDQLSVEPLETNFSKITNIIQQFPYTKSKFELTMRPQYVDILPINAIRKSKDYVYGVWVNKVLGIWKGYYRVKKSLVSCMKPWTEARNNKYMKYHSKLTCQLSFWNVRREMDYHAGGKWFIHGPKRRKENQLLSLKHLCWLSLV